MRAWVVFRLFVVLSARAAAPLAMPLFFGILVVAAILFGPTGMRAADAVKTMRSSAPFALLLWMGWFVLALPAARLALVPPSSSYLRWLPVPRYALYAAAATCALAVQLPWMILFGRGEGIVSALSAGFGAVALHALFLPRPMGIVHGLGLAAWSISVFHSNLALSFSAACFAVVIAVKTVIDRAPEVSAEPRGRMRLRSPMRGLAVAHFVYLVRVEPAVLGRALVMTILAGLILPLAARGHDLELPPSFGGLALGLSAVALPVGLSGIAAAVIRSERVSAWICDCTGTSAQTRALASAMAVAVMGAASGLLLGVIASILLPASLPIAARLLTIPAIFGLATGASFAGLARNADASPRRGDRGMVMALVATAIGIISASFWGERGLVFPFLLAILLVLDAPYGAECIRRRRGAS